MENSFLQMMQTTILIPIISLVLGAFIYDPPCLAELPYKISTLPSSPSTATF